MLVMNNHKQTDFHRVIPLIDELIARKELEFRLAEEIQDPNFGGRLLPKEGMQELVSWIEASQFDIPSFWAISILAINFFFI